ncbi:TonB-dependent receptor [Shewanella denitrificans OS217]|uniref:TonB-dependent receptor n=1 Tax=Shewanella denitrificans (strain OS217 / ATCC BAA-1090 / DSM 15013) TaxID=318161 RepID=Q12LS5_SHEDO|nr:TonB-dependent receptor [Shewanella denitrificans]ABE55601.1 TonB-dependent receptor [Shewanella denitrificans OS217]
MSAPTCLSLPVKSTLTLAIMAALTVPAVATTADIERRALDGDKMEVIVVNADFSGINLDKMPSSVTVIDAQQLEDEGAQHFEDVLNSIANFNWSGGSSRPKYFQIRGVGEQEDYKGAPNSSVGFIMDDIDLSGLGSIASMYDMQQVEVLRGPQGTQYGANALAGLIYLKSNDPSQESEQGMEVSVGDDNLTTFAGFSSGPVSDSGKLLYRISVEKHNQDGFKDNLYLGRADTNERDEFNTRAKLRWYATDTLQLDLTLLHANFDNGYDAWTLDNNGRQTLTDLPGTDNQQTTGAGFKAIYSGAEQFELTSLTSFASTDHQHAYDGDWANDSYWSSKQCAVWDEDWTMSLGSLPCVYNATWDKKAERDTLTQEFRLASKESGKIFFDSTSWLIGVYGRQLKEDNSLIDYARYSNGQVNPSVKERTKYLDSQYDASNFAIFGQLDSELEHGYLLSAGLRIERRNSDYSDTNGDDFNPSETMWGGHLSLSKSINSQHTAYTRLAKGYKSGGFNMSLTEDFADKRSYDAETLNNLEIGLKSSWLDGDLVTNTALFYMTRDDQQVSTSLQNPNDKSDFIMFTDNAGKSNNYGMEFDFDWYATNKVKFYGSLGWLNAKYDEYQYAVSETEKANLNGRDLAHSPKLTYSAGMTYLADTGWFVNLNASGKSEFYYSDSNESTSEPYVIMNARVGYETQTWSAYLWGRNLFDEEYGVRGFYFGNEPDSDWADKQYLRFGDPRQLGLTLSVKFM